MAHTLKELKDLRDKKTILNMGIAGVTGGAGIAAVMGLLDHFKRLSKIKEVKEEQETKTRRLKRVQAKLLQEEKTANVSPTAITTGAVGALVSLVLTKTLITKALIKNDKKALEELKGKYKGELEERRDLLTKQADTTPPKGRGFTTGEGALSGVGAIPVLLALGTAIAAHQYLKHLDPVATAKRREEEEGEGIDAIRLMEDKLASFTLPVVVTLQLKKARHGPLGDIVGTVLEGNGSKLAQAFITDPEAALDSIQGAHRVLEGLTEDTLVKAASDVWATPSLAPIAMVYTQAEMQEHFPFITKVAAGMAPEDKEAIQKSIMARIFKNREGEEPAKHVLDFIDGGDASDDE